MEHPVDDGDGDDGLETGGELNFSPDVRELRDALVETREELRQTREELHRLAAHVESIEEHDEPAGADRPDEGLEIAREP
jgi:hypothetical protein